MATMNDVVVNKINELHRGIEDKLRSSVSDAIEIGRLLTEKKGQLQHGDFLPWLKGNCNFSQKTAWSYMKLNEHQCKLESVTNLQEAYRQIETIEKQEKQSETAKAWKRVNYFIKTGNKPEGWRRGTDDKLYQDEIERQERFKKMRERQKEIDEKMERERIEREKLKDDMKKGQEDLNDFLSMAAEASLTNHKKRQEFKAKIKVSQSGESDLFIDALMDYLEELEDDNRRIEACQNIIKVCRNYAAELQAVKN
jgi:hypothetical protein